MSRSWSHHERLAGWGPVPAWVLVGIAAILTPSSSALEAQQSSNALGHENRATPVDRIQAADGFHVELLYSVPADQQGSWVNLCLDGKNRILVSDQFGGLYRFSVPGPDAALDSATIEPVPANIRAVNGMVWYRDALYVGVNDYERKMASGLYRVTDSDGDDALDHVELLRAFQARGDHGVHAVVPAPDGDTIFLITGNSTRPTDYDRTRVPPVWGEDHLLPRMPDGRGHNRGVLAPGGIIYQVSPDGMHWEVYSAGYRNIFDAAFNRDGELFTYDADMEYDFNTPWYRPTRVNHATSGSEYGWRHGAGKRPEWYPDNLPGIVNIGPGSPTGTVFGYGSRFPSRFQEALYLLDWSWGKIYSVVLEPDGSSYRGTVEEFVSGTPLPVTDAIIHPEDGAMYFTIGGRRVQSGLYRVTYQGAEPSDRIPAGPVAAETPFPNESEAREARQHRRALEAFHGREDPDAIPHAWADLSHPDRFIRWAARTAVEHQPMEAWRDRALAETDSSVRVEALLALARVGGVDPLHRDEADAPSDPGLRDALIDSLLEVPWESLSERERITLVRTHQIVLNRFGMPDPARADRILDQLDPRFPAGSFPVNWVLCETLAALQSPALAAKAVPLLNQAATQEEQMQYARSLRFLRAGWTPELRIAYFEWFHRAANYRGGASFEKFVEFIRNDALDQLPEAARAHPDLQAVLNRAPDRKSPLQAWAEALAGRSFVKTWGVEELTTAAAAAGLANSEGHGRDPERGRRMFGAAGCFVCHRFANEGGMTGPDLTSAGGRYSVRDLLVQIIHPSAEINEQFAPIVLTKTNGDTVSGVIVNLKGDTVIVNTDLSNPNQREQINRNQVASIEPATISTMPEGLLNVLEKEEILDLLAYVLFGTGN